MLRTIALVFAGLAWLGCHAGPAPSPAPVTFESRADELVALLALEETRSSAREQLEALGDAALPAYARGLAHESPQVRAEIVSLISAISGARSTDLLAEAAVAEPVPQVRWRALAGLGEVATAEEAASRLRPSLQDEDAARRWHAAVALALLARPDGLAEIHRGVSHPDPFRRWEAIHALGRVHDETTVSVLRPALRSPSVRDRGEVVLTLGNIGGAEAVALLHEAFDDESHEVRWRAAMALGKAGAETDVPQLRAIAAADPHPQVREHAASAIRKIEGRAVTARPR